MPYEIDETHDPKLESWVESANDPATDFPIQNLPLCDFFRDKGGQPLAGIRIGDRILDLSRCAERGLLGSATDSEPDLLTLVLKQSVETSVIAQMFDQEPTSRSGFRLRFHHLLRKDSVVANDRQLQDDITVSASDVDMYNCVHPTDYTDFYASAFHATNVGSMFRPDNPLLPNYKHIPIAYHGRASSIVPSGTDIIRPSGQMAPAEEGGSPGFGPCKMLDYELEVGLIVGRGNELGTPIPITEAEDHILGMCLVNDWSARDLQKWEYQPLGPFLAKSFATTVSPYIVTMEALAPFRTPAYERPAGDPQPLPYLTSEANTSAGGVDLTLEVYLQSAQMRQRSMDPIRLSRGSFKDMYWTIAQMLTHHASNGCNLQPGDLMASGTVSGPAREARGCLLELTWDGDPFANPPTIVPGTQRTSIELPTGEMRKFLEDGDEVIIKGYCEREGFRRIGFGECRGRILPAR